VPPWQPEADDPRPPERRAADRLARQTLLKLQQAGRSVFLDPGLEAVSAKIMEARKRKDESGAAQHRQEYGQLILDLRRQKLRRVRDGGEGPIDVALADEYLAMITAAESDALATAGKPPAPGKPKRRPALLPEPKDSEVARRLGPRLGQLPVQAAPSETPGVLRPAPGADRYAVRGGWATRKASDLRFNWMSFVSLADGAPTVVRWLNAKGCRTFRYNFDAPAAARVFADDAEDSRSTDDGEPDDEEELF
jgi:hypothetical protein